MYRNIPPDPSSRVRFAPSGAAAFTEPAAPAGSVQAALAQSAEILSRLAASRPNGYLGASDLMEMAANPHGDYAETVQKAARVFLANGRNVHFAFEHNRRRNAHSRASGSSSRRYGYGDLQDLSSFWMTSALAGAQRVVAGAARLVEGVATDIYERALGDMAGYMQGRSRHSVSADGLIFMDQQGFAPASVLLGDMGRTGSLLERAFDAEFRLIYARVEEALANPQGAAAGMQARQGPVPRREAATLTEVDELDEQDEDEQDDEADRDDEGVDPSPSLGPDIGGQRQRQQRQDSVETENRRLQRLRLERIQQESAALNALNVQDDLNVQRRQNEVLLQDRHNDEVLRELIQDDERHRAVERAQQLASD